MDKPLLWPDDELNRNLLKNLHPKDWQNPKAAPKYNLVVIGAGTAGLVTAAAAAKLGAKVALVEKYLMGGDCLNFGCVPSKAILRSAKLAAEFKGAERFGLRLNGKVEVDFKAVMARMRQIRLSISQHDSVERFRDLGVDIFLGEARFKDVQSAEVAGQTLKFSKAIIASGGRASIPDIAGLEEAGYLTNHSIFSLTKLPKSLAVLGGGPIGCELAQAFSRLGSKVSIFHKNERLLNRDDPAAAEVLQKAFLEEGIKLNLGCKLKEVRAGQLKEITYEAEGKNLKAEFEAILVATGRTPNVESLNLAAANIEYDLKEGIKIDDHLRTTNPKVFAIGDVCLPWKYTHAADEAARIALKNALFLGRARLSNLVMPWCTYTDPEVAHTGLTVDEAAAKGIELETILVNFDRVDRAILEGEDVGFVKLLVKKGSDRLLGATIVSRGAGNLISEVTMAIKTGIGLKEIDDIIHPYPTQAQAIRRGANMYQRKRLKEEFKPFLKLWFNWSL